MEAKSRIVQIRVAPSDYERIKRHADKCRKRPSTMARDMILDWLDKEDTKSEHGA